LTGVKMYFALGTSIPQECPSIKVKTEIRKYFGKHIKQRKQNYCKG